MDLIDIQKKVKDLSKNLQQINELLSKNIKQQMKETHIIPIGEEYYVLECTSEAIKNIGSELDKINALTHTIFAEKAEVKEWLKAKEIQKELRQLCKENPVDWNDVRSYKYYLSLDMDYNKQLNLTMEKCFSFKTQGTEYCNNPMSLFEFIQKHGKENIIKYIFEIGLPQPYQLEIK